MEKEELEKKMQIVQKTLEESQESEKKHRMQIQSMNSKCDLKQYIADEAEKDKKLLEGKLEISQREIKDLTVSNEIHEQLKNLTNKDKHEWAKTTRKNYMDDYQAQVFFEAYKLQLVKEQELKMDKEQQSDMIENQQRKISMLDLELGDLKRKVAKLRKQADEA